MSELLCRDTGTPTQCSMMTYVSPFTDFSLVIPLLLVSPDMLSGTEQHDCVLEDNMRPHLTKNSVHREEASKRKGGSGSA